MNSCFFIFSFIVYEYCELKEFHKNTYGFIIYKICSKIKELNNEEYLKGIWPIIEKYEKSLKKLININKGTFQIVYALIKPFTEDPILCPVYSVYDSCLCSIGKKIKFEKEYRNPVCYVEEEDIDKNNNNYSLITALGDN